MRTWRHRHPETIGFVVLTLPLAIMVAVVLWINGLPSVPSVPPPPDWLSRAAATFTAQVAPVLYWEMAVVLLAVYEVLRWQRSYDETDAAKWYRRFQLSKAFVWLTLAVGRTIFQDWLLVGWAIIVLYVAWMLNATAISLVTTYALPLWKCRNGRCAPAVPPLDGGLLPGRPWMVERDGDRRSGRERRKGWRAVE